MTINLRPGSTVVFVGDSITDCQRLESEDGLGFGYPLRVAGEWDFRYSHRAVNWLNVARGGDKVMDLEARWRADVLGARPNVVSILVGINDVGWQTLSPQGRPIPLGEFEAGYDRLLAPLTEAGTTVIMIEPFLLPIRGVVEAGRGYALIGEKERKEWRADLDPKIEVVRELARRHGAHLIGADDMFAKLAATTGPEYWAADGIHPTPAGHAALAAAWLRLVT
ncbi:GDSL-type esterase/lipase family protein [Amycolatopsis sp. cg5]|uniref:GDSL-type esterase/lipase family protein n=1 Tax=Amycolatopsis sp. cg5 TaxID=3238802 RepID=UPI003525179F